MMIYRKKNKRGKTRRSAVGNRLAIRSSVWILSLLFLNGNVFAQTEMPPPPKVPPVARPTPFPEIEKPPVVAEDYQSRRTVLSGNQRVGVSMAEVLSLTLNDAIRVALENNIDIEVARTEVEKREFRLRAARGVYDPAITFQPTFTRSRTPVASAFGGNSSGAVTETEFDAAAGFNGFSRRGGGEYAVDLSLTRTTTNDAFTQLNPQTATSLNFSYVQPLFRGFRFDIRRRDIEIAKRNVSLSDAQFRERTIEIVAQVEMAYWDLIFALRNWQVRIEARDEAIKQVESNRRQVEQGVLAPVDVVAAETQVANFEQQIYEAQESVTRTENILKTLMLPDRRHAFWNRALVPTTPLEIELPETLLETATTAALINRQEIKQGDANLEINSINARYLRNQTRPQIDLVGTYQSNGLAGTIAAGSTSPFGNDTDLRTRVNQLSALNNLPPLPATPVNTVSSNLSGNFFNSFGSLFTNRYPTYQIGVRFSIPLRNTVAEAELGESLVERRRLERLKAQTEQTIESEVRNALQAVQSARARLQSAGVARRLSETQYESEQNRFRAGTSTLFLVLERQTAVVTARGNELQAQTNLNRAVAEFNRATGRTLEANQVSIQDGGLREFRIAIPFDSGEVRTSALKP